MRTTLCICKYFPTADELAPIFSAHDIYDDKFYCYDLSEFLKLSTQVTTKVIEFYTTR